MMTLQIHPAAMWLPELNGSEFQELVDDIQKRGLREPILVKDGFIVDGRHRYKACEQLGIEPQTEEYQGDDIIAEIASRNLFRRNLTPRQRAELVVKMLGDRLSADARDRQRSALKGGTESPVGATLPQREKGRTRDKIAELAKVSARTAHKALRTHKGVAVPKKKRPKPERTFKQEVLRRFQRWMDYFPVSKHRQAKLELVTCLLGQYDRKSNELIAPVSVSFSDGSTSNIDKIISGEQ
jgi:hypothetical protein